MTRHATARSAIRSRSTDGKNRSSGVASAWYRFPACVTIDRRSVVTSAGRPVVEREPSVVTAATGECPPVAEREALAVRRAHEPDTVRPLTRDLACELAGDLRAEADEQREHECEVRPGRSLQPPCQLDHALDALRVR